ncbi:MAG: ABC-2 transporter permease [Oscillospiraceae bacterium]|nr:ABC-2 transporter permease [Oscillospiraceae bacterium]
MKGLILKDLYMTKAYLRAFVILMVGFIFLSAFSAENAFFLFYPAILAGTIPFSLIAYDERSKWNQYCETLPVSRKTVVSARYIVALGFFFAVFLLTAIIKPFSPAFSFESYISDLCLLLTMGLLTPTVLLPLVFRFGVERGRLFYYIIIGVFCALSVTAADISHLTGSFRGVPLFLLPLVTLVLFALSWLISIRIYERKEF